MSHFKYIKDLTEQLLSAACSLVQESPAVADKPARRKSMLKLLQFDDWRAYNVVADNTGLSSFV